MDSRKGYTSSLFAFQTWNTIKYLQRFKIGIIGKWWESDTLLTWIWSSSEILQSDVAFVHQIPKGLHKSHIKIDNCILHLANCNISIEAVDRNINLIVRRGEYLLLDEEIGMICRITVGNQLRWGSYACQVDWDANVWNLATRCNLLLEIEGEALSH
jgi:hypothetical protein